MFLSLFTSLAENSHMYLLYGGILSIVNYFLYDFVVAFIKNICRVNTIRIYNQGDSTKALYDDYESKTFHAISEYISRQKTYHSYHTEYSLFVNKEKSKNEPYVMHTVTPGTMIYIDGLFIRLQTDYSNMSLIGRGKSGSVQTKMYYQITAAFTTKEHLLNKVLAIEKEYGDITLKKSREFVKHHRHKKIRVFINDECNWSTVSSLNSWGGVANHDGSDDETNSEDERREPFFSKAGKILCEDLDMFLCKKNTILYQRLSKPMHRGYLLYGPPGTGKSTAIMNVCTKYGFHIYNLNLDSIKNDSDLLYLMNTVKPRSVICIEDIDTSKCILDPKNAPFSISALLNALDGSMSRNVNMRCIMITANDISKLPAALLRHGRVDKQIEFAPLEEAEVHEFVANIFSDTTIDIKEHVSISSGTKITLCDIIERITQSMNANGLDLEASWKMKIE